MSTTQGWICPNCKTGINPALDTCPRCYPKFQPYVPYIYPYISPTTVPYYPTLPIVTCIMGNNAGTLLNG